MASVGKSDLETQERQSVEMAPDMVKPAGEDAANANELKMENLKIEDSKPDDKKTEVERTDEMKPEVNLKVNPEEKEAEDKEVEDKEAHDKRNASLFERLRELWRDSKEIPKEMMQEAFTAKWKSVYHKSLPEDTGEFEALLRDYSGIPPEEITNHLYNIRDKAWKVARYPCIGRWSFISLRQVHDARAEAAKQRLMAPGSQDKLLDLACCVGQFIRKFAHDGVQVSQLCGSDLRPEFIEIGYELFRDRDRLPPSCFAPGDMLNPADASLARLDGSITLVHASNFFHLFGWKSQVVIGERIIRFLKPGTENAVVFGRHIGTVAPGGEAAKKEDGRYLHDEQSFQMLWDEVGRRTGTRWRVEMAVLGGLQIPIPLPNFDSNSRYYRYGVYQTK